jgi:hypothetical protein
LKDKLLLATLPKNIKIILTNHFKIQLIPAQQRTNKMKHRPTTSTQNALQFYCNSADADKSIKAEISDLLASHDTLQSVISSNERTLAEAVEAWRTAEREAPATVATAHKNHKPIDTAKLVAKIQNLCDQKNEIQNILQLNKFALPTLTTALTKMLQQYEAEFVRWVAVQRCNDLTACGEVMPIEVETLWQKLDIRIFKWVEGLTMPADKMKLPLIYWANEFDKYRASVAWVWLELANKQFKFVPISKSDSRPSLKLLGDPETLPAVPKTKALAETA